MTDPHKLLSMLAGLRDRKILVLGDVMLDVYDFCSSAESKPIDSEKPGKRAYTAHESVRRLGGAGNVATNLAALGAHATLVGLAGGDGHGHTVRALCNAAHLSHTLLGPPSRTTTTKTRIYIDDEYLLRKDHEDATPIDGTSARAIAEAVGNHLDAGMDAVILSDYHKGLFTAESAPLILDLCHRRGLPVVVDFKPANKALFRGAGLLVPNESEADALLPGFKGHQDLPSALAALKQELDAPSIVVTLGARGLCGMSPETGFFHHSGHPVRAVDAVGCGDTVRAVLALGLAAGLNLRQAAALANHAAAVIVQKPATATLTVDELAAFIASTAG